MAGASSLQPRIFSSFVGDRRFIRSTRHLHQLFGYDLGSKQMSMQLSKTFAGIMDLLFNKRAVDAVPADQRKRLMPGKLSPCRPVPEHIVLPPYVKSRKPPGISSGPEVHDDVGIECMRASGRLAAQVLQHAGTLVKGPIHPLCASEFMKTEGSTVFFCAICGLKVQKATPP